MWARLKFVLVGLAAGAAGFVFFLGLVVLLALGSVPAWVLPALLAVAALLSGALAVALWTFVRRLWPRLIL